MTLERQICVEGNVYTVVMSDEKGTLLAAQAAGRVIVGLLQDNAVDADLSPAKYLYLMDTTQAADDAANAGLPDDAYLERVVRRTLGLPWVIAESESLLIREFTMADLPAVMPETNDQPDDAVFYTPELLQAYIREQYGYYECGLWAVIRKSDNRLIGKAGLVPDLSGDYALGYHIFTPFRRQGYAKEACRLILHYLDEEYGGQAIAYVMPDNLASIRLLEMLGFQLCQETSDADSVPEAASTYIQTYTQGLRLRYQRAASC
jgi:RimJ/RimL family protein N-acetyltransferase